MRLKSKLLYVSNAHLERIFLKQMIVFETKLLCIRHATRWEAGGARAPPPLFGKSVNPISTRGGTLFPPSTMCPQIFRPCDGPEAKRILGFEHKLREHPFIT